MNWKILNQPLGMSNQSGGYAPVKKELLWVVPAVMAAASIASTAYGASQSAAANSKARAQVDRERAINDAERRRTKYEDYIDTAAGQNLIRVARDEANKIWKREQGAAAVSGATESAKQMAKDSANQMMGNAIANIAANDTARKDNLDASYRATDKQLAQQQIALDQQKGQNIANAASQIGSTLMGAAASYMGTAMGQGSPGGGGVTAGPATSKLANMGTTFYNNTQSLNPFIHQAITGFGGL